ncbi:UbiH/UbiF family hydroxylase [Pigmentiphaga soli]|uniref:UbiH/UbiF family hydroxylase n=1 Tax=Pigmentiphaga soli TaxID=1007095 RepID=A0ABP8HSH4_9BURK
MASFPQQADIAVVGTGIVGLACALALARTGQRVALLGPKAPLPPAGDVFDPRVYALSVASRDLLAELGVWDTLPADRLAEVRAMEIAGDGPAPGPLRMPAGHLHLSAWQGGYDCLAWIAESTELERVLRQAVQWSGVPWLADTLAGREADAGGQSVLLTAGGQRLACRLAVAADGARSPLRAAAGIAMRRRDYDTIALVMHFTAELPHQGRACQWFTGDGVLALLPMPDVAGAPQVSMVWSMPTARARALLDLPADGQAAAVPELLAQATGLRFGALAARGPLLGFPLALQTVSRLTDGAGVALVGDAAHLVHPLAGQGLNLGLGDVRALARAVAGRETYRQVNDARVLRRYERERAEPLLAMRAVTDGLQRLFGSHAPPVAWLRNAGMNAIDRLPLLKRALIDGASGR